MAEPNFKQSSLNFQANPDKGRCLIDRLIITSAVASFAIRSIICQYIIALKKLDSCHEKLRDMTMANVWANLFGPFWPNVWLWFGHTLLRTLKGPTGILEAPENT